MFYMGLCWCPCVIVKQRLGRTSRNISFKAKKESSILHAERQSGANESQQECNAVWLILGSLSAWFYWEKWDDDRWISALTAGVEGRVIVAERWRVFSVLAEANQSGLLSERCRPTAACVCDTKRLGVNGRRTESRLFLCCYAVEVVTGDAAVDDADGRGCHLRTGCELMERVQAAFLSLRFRGHKQLSPHQTQLRLRPPHAF